MGRQGQCAAPDGSVACACRTSPRGVLPLASWRPALNLPCSAGMSQKKRNSCRLESTNTPGVPKAGGTALCNCPGGSQLCPLSWPGADQGVNWPDLP